MVRITARHAYTLILQRYGIIVDTIGPRSNPPVRYLVHCARCDRAFWQAARDAPVPEHSRWDRRATTQHAAESRCDGSVQPGYWIAEGAGPLTGWPR